jgi:hypothetical protein
MWSLCSSTLEILAFRERGCESVYFTLIDGDSFSEKDRWRCWQSPYNSFVDWVAVPSASLFISWCPLRPYVYIYHLVRVGVCVRFGCGCVRGMYGVSVCLYRCVWHVRCVGCVRVQCVCLCVFVYGVCVVCAVCLWVCTGVCVSVCTMCVCVFSYTSCQIPYRRREVSAAGAYLNPPRNPFVSFYCSYFCSLIVSSLLLLGGRRSPSF